MTHTTLCLALATVVSVSLLHAANATSCSAYGYTGTCMSTASCTAQGGGSVAGFCPGSSDNQCCLQISCSTSSGAGKCRSTDVSNQCQGTSFSGLCPGPSSFKCCVASSPSTSCSAYGYSGTCMSTASCTAQGGGSVAGFCSGGSDNQCCLKVPCGSSGTCKSTAVSGQCQGSTAANLCPGPSSFTCCGISSSGGSNPSQIVDLALSAANGNALSGWSGGSIPYVWGGGHGRSAGPSYGTCDGYTGSIKPCPADSTIGVDCSGFTRWIYSLAYGRDVLGSGTAQSQASRMTRVGSPQAGDLVFFGSDFHHVGIYIGNGKMVNAPYTGVNVRVDSIGSNVQGYYRA